MKQVALYVRGDAVKLTFVEADFVLWRFNIDWPVCSCMVVLVGVFDVAGHIGGYCYLRYHPQRLCYNACRNRYLFRYCDRSAGMLCIDFFHL